MFKRKQIVQHATIWVGSAALAACLFNSALAQTSPTVSATKAATPPTPPVALHSTTELADHIAGQFVKRYGDGSVGNDWCFNVETERGYSYWYYGIGAIDTPLYAQKIRSTARIQATYEDSITGVRTYASVFLGLQIADDVALPFREFDLNRAPTIADASTTPGTKPLSTTKPSPKPKAAVTGKPTLNMPNRDDNEGSSYCVKFADFLDSYVLPNKLNATGTVGTQDDGSFQPSYPLAARWWMFNGRGHQIFNVTQYAIKLTPPKSKVETVVNLIVGFGGGAGP